MFFTAIELIRWGDKNKKTMTITPDSSNSEINQEDKLVISGNDQLLLTVGLGKKQILEQLSLTTNIIKGTALIVESNSRLKTAITPRILLFTS